MALLAACKSKNTVCSEFYSNFSESGLFTLEHPSGSLKIDYEVKYKNDVSTLPVPLNRALSTYSNNILELKNFF